MSVELNSPPATDEQLTDFEEYANRLRNDLQKLGFNPESYPDRPLASLYDLVEYFTDIGCCESLTNKQTSLVETSLGREIKTWLPEGSSENIFRIYVGTHICAHAESLFIKSTAPEVINDSDTPFTINNHRRPRLSCGHN